MPSRRFGRIDKELPAASRVLPFGGANERAQRYLFALTKHHGAVAGFA